MYSQQFPGFEVEEHLQETMPSPLTMLRDVAFPVARQVQGGVAHGLADRARGDVDASTCGSRSTTATCFPSFEAWIAARWPAGPDPITTKS